MRKLFSIAIQILLLKWIQDWKNAKPDMQDVDWVRMMDEDVFAALDYRQLLFGTGLRLLEGQREQITSKWAGTLELGDGTLIAVVDEVGVGFHSRFHFQERLSVRFPDAGISYVAKRNVDMQTFGADDGV
jgi:hypothetical protein